MANLVLSACLIRIPLYIVMFQPQAALLMDADLAELAVNIFRHNNASSLGSLIDSDSKSKRKIIITEGIFSMNGDIARLSEICFLAKNANALIILDDAYGDFIFGRPKNYSSIEGLIFGVSRLIDIQVSSLSKAIGCLETRCDVAFNKGIIDKQIQTFYLHISSRRISVEPYCSQFLWRQQLTKKL